MADSPSSDQAGRNSRSAQNVGDALAREESGLRILADHLPALISYVDAEQRYRFVNRAYEEWHGVPADHIVGSTVRDLLNEAAYEQARPHIEAALAGAQVEYELDHPFDSEEPRTLSVRYVPDVDADGAARGFFALITDITEATLAQQQLRLGKERYRNLVHAILDTAIDGIVTIDERGTIESINPAAQRMFGYSADDACGHSVNMLMPPPYAAEHDGYLTRYLETGERRIIGIGREVVGRRRDGATFPLDLAVSEVQTDAGRRFAAVLRDMTERKQLEAELLQAQKMEAIGRLAGGIAHDFNNLLMGIIGCCRTAADQLDGHPAKALVDDVSREADRGAGLTRQLLTFSRKQRVAPKPLELNAVVDGATTMIRHMIAEDITMRVDLAPSGAPIVADQTQIEQILMNLAVNARDAMPSGGELRIETREVETGTGSAPRHARLSPGIYVALSVRDTGIGMDPATRAKVFEPFFTTKGPGEGTGLGLSTVYGIASQLGGHVDVKSEPGAGSLFTVYLPRNDNPPAAEPAPQLAAGASSGGETVLLVEDEALIRASVQYVLERHGYSVLAAANADEAEQQAGAPGVHIDLVLTDVVLPGLSGPEVVQRIRAHHPQAATLYMSAYPNEYLIEQGRIPADQASLEKPVADKILTARVREALDRAGS